MKLSVFMLLAAFIILAHRRARIGFVIAYCAAAYVFLCVSGCYTVERPSEYSNPRRPITCGAVIAQRDGSYLLLNCRSL